MTRGLEIRPLRTREELRACVDLQEEIWGEGFSERVPVSLLHVTGRLGGVLAGAFDERGRLAGFVFGLTGLEGGEPVHWSDMLAVRPGQRDTGLGTRLKAHQRQALLGLGVRKAYWTFDPLESRNGYVNMGRLGAVAREYVEDAYPDSDSPLHLALGTDRLLALWLLDSARVVRRVEGTEAPPGPAILEGIPRALAPGEREGVLWPGEARLDVEEPRLAVAIPASTGELARRSLPAARAWRDATRRVLRHYLGRGLQVEELVRAGSVSYHVLGPVGPGLRAGSADPPDLPPPV